MPVTNLYNMLKGAPWLLAHRSMLKPNQPMKVSLYGNQKIKLNNEVGMDWVRRNFDNFPKVVEPNFSR